MSHKANQMLCSDKSVIPKGGSIDNGVNNAAFAISDENIERSSAVFEEATKYSHKLSTEHFHTTDEKQKSRTNNSFQYRIQNERGTSENKSDSKRKRSYSKDTDKRAISVVDENINMKTTDKEKSDRPGTDSGSGSAKMNVSNYTNEFGGKSLRNV